MRLLFPVGVFTFYGQNIMQTEVLTDHYVQICSASIQDNVTRRDIALKHKRSGTPRLSQVNSFGGTNGGTRQNQTRQ
jgi:hypothetical protein